MEYLEYLITFVLAFIIAFSSTPIARKLAFRLGAVDVPVDDRRMHKKPIALMGGAAIIVGFLVSVLFSTILPAKMFTPNLDLIGILAGIAVISLMGVLDDLKRLRAWIKLAFQLAAAFAVVFISDTRIMGITNPFVASNYTVFSPFISYTLTILWIVGITNAINLIDGLDGLAAGVASICSLSLFFVSLLRQDLDFGTKIYTLVLTAALAGSTLGFLPYNFNPAKIFMGETGSAFLGFTLGVITIQGGLKTYAAISIAIPLLVLGLPLFDTIFAILRRVANGKSFMKADRGHLHHRLIDMGLSHRQTVVVMYTASAALGLCAIVLADRGAISAIILLLAVAVFVIGGAKYMNEMGRSFEDEKDDSDEEEAEKKDDDKDPPSADPAVILENTTKGTVK
ncbi:MAG: undecaprenyl/decaprenyl-phosphate alpha-N-acetylglucosaminyl 1-phosphate transferase [Ruminiclostridium sp.]|nr:undecaprenyl/decaprenyl-phosphate alpha-N-acetylglucosaminyl 1-phosphate transferase [Ruminiclostridium sp.]